MRPRRGSGAMVEVSKVESGEYRGCTEAGLKAGNLGHREACRC